MRKPKERQRTGPKLPYGPKAWPARTHLLTAFAQGLLRAAVARTGHNESNLIEFLVRKHVGQLTTAEMEPEDDSEEAA